MATATQAVKQDVLTVELTLNRETKNTFRFDHPDGNDSVLPSLYVKKSVWKGQAPDSITVTVK